MKKYKILLADADDTILDFHKAERNALIAAYENLALPYDDEALRLYSEINDSLWKAFERGELSSSDEIARTRFGIYFARCGLKVDEIAFRKEYEKNLALGAYVFDDVFPTLTRLAEKVKIYIVTNGRTITQKSRLSLTGIDKIAAGVFISEEIGFRKPTKEYFDFVSEHIEGFDKESALLLGDSVTADMPAKIYGIATCLIDRKHRYAEIKNLNDLNADYLINDFREVEKFFI
ncbi:MAG: HAD family hydrolase [Christensenellaceae bacterium]|nr:HAD family hydrolase [Christensenellaceae bacterium]MDD6926535.1 HAD-IA family hydrolase [bacterium]MDY2851555.1 HAD-IA family hydrolase [Christensenellaceae bacterium]